jgi:hypothetical protein
MERGSNDHGEASARAALARTRARLEELSQEGAAIRGRFRRRARVFWPTAADRAAPDAELVRIEREAADLRRECQALQVAVERAMHWQRFFQPLREAHG